MIGSCSELWYEGEEMIFCRASRARAAAARSWRRIVASSGEAESAISSSPTIEVVIFSSKNLLECRAWK
jgi:hypothetical protein